MGTIGNYKYPGILLNRAIEIVKIINHDFGGTINRSALASKLNMSAVGGQFSMVINGCKEWKLIEGRSVIKLTENGVIVANPRNLEENQIVKDTIVRSVLFFEEFLKNFPRFDIRDPNFHVYLEEISGANRAEIDPQYKFLRLLFEEITNIVDKRNLFLKPKNLFEVNSDNSSLNNEIKEEGLENYIQITFRDVDVKLPDTKESIEAIISLLKAHKSL